MYDFVDPDRSCRFKNLKSTTYVQVKEIVSIFLATSLVDAVPGSNMHDAIAATE